jgi:predicted Holliday junction resolvase-like endonuclease
MDILSFGLGIAVVVIIGLSIISVIAFFKVKKIEKEIEKSESAIYRELQSLNREKHSDLAETHRRIDEFEREVYSQLDSRLDKLENKLTTKK